jgi:hypothetical protein
MRYKASKLRENIYKILDEILESGNTVEIERKGRIIRLVPDPPSAPRLQRLTAHPQALLCDPEELVELDWSSEWRP